MKIKRFNEFESNLLKENTELINSILDKISKLKEDGKWIDMEKSLTDYEKSGNGREAWQDLLVAFEGEVEQRLKVGRRQATIEQFFAAWGLPASMGTWAYERLLAGDTAEEIMLEVRNQDGYKERFPGMAALAAAIDAASSLIAVIPVATAAADVR